MSKLKSLAQVLDAPILARIVPHLSPETLHLLIRHQGLEACGDLVASATPAQLTALLDLDLWRELEPRRGEQFDVDRFGDWLEMLADTGSSTAARVVATLDTNIVVAGLSRYLRVFDPGIFEPIAQSDDEATNRHDAMHDGDVLEIDKSKHESSADWLECEVGGYIVRARRADAWDAIVELLIALDAEHASSFHAVMQGCRQLSNSNPEFGGLDDLLLAPEQHLHNVTIERERRRSQQGYATPADARTFLQMARRPEHEQVNPIVAAYFREMDEVLESLPAATPASDAPVEPAEAEDIPGSIATVIDLLAEAGMMPERPRALLGAGDTGPQAARLLLLRELMAYAHDANETTSFTRHRELAFLANTLLAGCSIQSRPFTLQEASDAAASICNLGLESWPIPRAAGATGLTDAFLIDHSLVTVFEMGWSRLYQDVSMFVVRELISMLDTLRSVDRDIQRSLVTLRRALVRHRDAGTPWLARDAVDVLGVLDMTACTSVIGLLDECPIMPLALTAILEGRTTPVSATAFDFISTAGQIEDIRNFMKQLPGVLSS